MLKQWLFVLCVSPLVAVAIRSVLDLEAGIQLLGLYILFLLMGISLSWPTLIVYLIVGAFIRYVGLQRIVLTLSSAILMVAAVLITFHYFGKEQDDWILIAYSVTAFCAAFVFRSDRLRVKSDGEEFEHGDHL